MVVKNVLVKTHSRENVKSKSAPSMVDFLTGVHSASVQRLAVMELNPDTENATILNQNMEENHVSVKLKKTEHVNLKNAQVIYLKNRFDVYTTYVQFMQF